MHVQVDLTLDPVKGVPKARSRDAAADREELLDQREHLATRRGGVRSRVGPAHEDSGLKSGYEASRSTMTGSGRGQSMPNAGSFQRTPRPACGAYAADIW